MRGSRYHRILDQWVGGKRGLGTDENKGENEVQGDAASSGEKEQVGVVSGIATISDLMRPLGELPDGVYLEVLGKFRSLLHELRVRLVEIFRSNSERFKIQYKLDIVDERLILLEELGQEVYKLTPKDLAKIHATKDKEEALMVDKLTPVLEKAQALALSEEEKFLDELNKKLRSNLERLTLELVDLQTRVSEVDKQLKDADETSSLFVSDAIETFRKWSENAKGVIKAVERAN
ncbi:hypothetical protein HWI79_1624 [Cryptosporidium felis]|nr:hypothetical protein HWI79_1624 [Cryptosporidium felis]